MKKLILLAMVIGLLVSNICYAQSGKEAVRALQKLQARVETGISYRDYAPALGDAKFEVNLFLQSPEAKEKQELASSITVSILTYELALSVWNLSFDQMRNRYARPGMILKNSISQLCNGHPEVAKEFEAWNGISRQAARNDQIPAEYIIRGLWREAGKELEKATSLL